MTPPTRPARILRRQIAFELPVRAVNSSNTREHWSARGERAEAQRRAAFLALRPKLRAIDLELVPPLQVTLIRISPRGKTMDDDGVITALKHVRDGIADALGEVGLVRQVRQGGGMAGDDSDTRVRWAYGQKREPGGVVSVWIEIREVR